MMSKKSLNIYQPTLHSFNSWEDRRTMSLSFTHHPVGTVIDVEIITDDDGERLSSCQIKGINHRQNMFYILWFCRFSWRRRCSIDPIETRDGILVIGKKKVYVNKQVCQQILQVSYLLEVPISIFYETFLNMRKDFFEFFSMRPGERIASDLYCDHIIYI